MSQIAQAWHARHSRNARTRNGCWLAAAAWCMLVDVAVAHVRLLVAHCSLRLVVCSLSSIQRSCLRGSLDPMCVHANLLLAQHDPTPIDPTLLNTIRHRTADHRGLKTYKAKRSVR